MRPVRITPLIGLSSVAATGNIYAGLYYPMIVAGMTFIVGNCCCARPKERTFGPKPAAKDLRRWANDPLAAGFKVREVLDAAGSEDHGGISIFG